MNKKVGIGVIALVVLCTACHDGFDNPLDPDASSYQGYWTVEGVGNIRFNAPEDGDSLLWARFILSEALDATAYRLQIDESEGFDDGTILYDSGEVTTHLIDVDAAIFTVGSTYYARSCALGTDGTWGEWTEAVSFVPTGVSTETVVPSNAARLIDTTPELAWDAIDGAVSYRVRYAESEAGLESAEIGTSTGSSYTIPEAVTNGSTVYWQVQGVNEDGVYAFWSEVFSFSVNIEGGITIETDLENPFEIVVEGIGNDGTVSVGDSITVVAPESADSYIWYLDGVEVQGGTMAAYTIPEGIAHGSYTYSVVVSQQNVVSSISQSIEIGFYIDSIQFGPWMEDADTVALWHLDGDGQDESTNNYDWTFNLQASEYDWVTGKYDTALGIDGNSSIVTWRNIYTSGFAVPDSSFTIEMSFFLESLPPQYETWLITQYSPGISGYDPFQLRITSSGYLQGILMKAGVNQNAPSVTVDINELLNQWVHVAYVYRYCTSSELWINGEKVTEVSNPYAPFSSTSYDWYIGSKGEEVSYPVIIDEVRISNVARYPVE